MTLRARILAVLRPDRDLSQYEIADMIDASRWRTGVALNSMLRIGMIARTEKGHPGKPGRWKAKEVAN